MANRKAVIMPISTQQMIDDLISNHHLTIKEIAHSLGGDFTDDLPIAKK